MARTTGRMETELGASPEEAKLDAAEAAAQITAGARLIGTADPELAGFFTGFTRYASPEDLNDYSGAELAALVKLVFGRTQRRRSGDCLVEIFDPSREGISARHETIVLAVNEDIPFLYDLHGGSSRQGGTDRSRIPSCDRVTPR